MDSITEPRFLDKTILRQNIDNMKRSIASHNWWCDHIGALREGSFLYMWSPWKCITCGVSLKCYSRKMPYEVPELIELDGIWLPPLFRYNM
jgi:hypothetical protein